MLINGLNYGPNGVPMNPAPMVDGLRTYTFATMDSGININAADITIGQQAINSLPFTGNTFNWSAGRLAGWTTRYGISPVPGHNSIENGPILTIGSLNGYPLRNLVAAEQGQAAYPYAGYDVYQNRTFMYGAVIVSLPVGVTNAGSTVPMLYWMSGRSISGGTQFDLVPSTDAISTGDGMSLRSHLEAPVGGGTAFLSLAGGFASTDRLDIKDLAGLRSTTTNFTNKYLRYTQIQTSISTNINEFITTGDANNTPSIQYFVGAGVPFWINYKQQRKNVSFSMTQADQLGQVGFTFTNNAYLSQTVGDLVGTLPTQAAYRTGSGSLNFPGVTNTYLRNGANFAATEYGSMYYFCTINPVPVVVPVTILAMVTNKPLIALWNPYVRGSTEADPVATYGAAAYSSTNPATVSNDFVQWLDPTHTLYAPTSLNTTNATGSGTAYYTETGAAAGATAVVQQTCWGSAPSYVFGTATSNVVAGAGVLSQSTTYEYAFSVYNVLTGKETNVGAPAQAYISSANSAIKVWAPGTHANNGADCLFPNVGFSNLGGATSPVSGAPINFLYYRLYYRELGSYEWLSSGQYSFASIYFNGQNTTIFIGSYNSGAAGTGGQPGDYNDFSDLPTDDYIDVASFQGRLFWLTRGQLCFSRSDDVLSYPVNNFAAAGRGEFRGMIPHFFAGQASQNGRLVVFGSDGSFTGFFTGNLQQTTVQVSPTAPPIAVYVDGSDFQLSPRGSETAFSGRTAVVAEGILYFMGPTGIYRDDGVALPKRISQSIEPLVFESYDKTSTDQFFAYYNKRSAEILFFYRPDALRPDLNPQNYLTKAWVYAIRTESFEVQSDLVNFRGEVAGDQPGAWSQYGYNQLIDWAQDLDLTRFETVPHAPGVRTLIGSRLNGSATVSRPYYHDDNCSGGDYSPGNEMMVKAIATPDASTMRFVLANGYSTTILSAIVVGTKISVQGSTTFGDMARSANVDGFYVVKATDNINGYIDVDNSTIPSSVAAQGFTLAQFFPIFVDGFHNISCVFQTNYLAPESLFTWHQLRWMHFLIKPVPTTQGTVIPYVTAKWEGNHQQATSTATKNLSVYALNSRESTTQIITDVPSPNMEAQAQAVRLTLTYNQIGGRWTLYLGAGYYEYTANDTKMYQREYG